MIRERPIGQILLRSNLHPTILVIRPISSTGRKWLGRGPDRGITLTGTIQAGNSPSDRFDQNFTFKDEAPTSIVFERHLAQQFGRMQPKSQLVILDRLPRSPADSEIGDPIRYIPPERGSSLFAPTGANEKRVWIIQRLLHEGGDLFLRMLPICIQRDHTDGPMHQRMIQWIGRRSRHLVFYCHPSEFVLARDQQFPHAMSECNRKGMGPENLPLVENILNHVLAHRYLPMRRRIPRCTSLTWASQSYYQQVDLGPSLFYSSRGGLP